MRYRVKGVEIRTENTAKPVCQAARSVLRWIEGHPPVEAALDYGCGKLRYAKALASRCSRLTLVDSRVQLERTQMINGCRTSVREYVDAHLPEARTLSADDFTKDRETYDTVICANVLSAIPCARKRSQVLRAILRALKQEGECLFVTQYRNSYFSKVSASPDAIPHLDGWILKTARGAFYYGVLPLTRLQPLLRRHGFNVLRSWINGQRASVLAGRGGRSV